MENGAPIPPIKSNVQYNFIGWTHFIKPWYGGEITDMWGFIITVFLALYSFMCYYIGRKGWTIFVQSASRMGRVLFFSVLALLILPFPLAELGEDLLPDQVVSWLTIWGGQSMIAVLYLFFLVFLINVIRFIDRWVSFVPLSIKDHKRTPLVLATVVILLAFGAVAYGSWNARNPIIQKYEMTVDKEAGSLKQLRIAMVSDIHYGPIIDVERLKKLKNMIDEINPDIVLLAGDITDGSLPPGEAEKLAGALGQIQAPYGTYAVPGNHDRDLRDPNSKLMRSMKKEGVHVLKDDHLLINNSFYLIGRDDPNRRANPARKELGELMKGIDPSKPLILLDHQPLELDKAKAHGIDLQLSGHTHNGQIFPANLITAMIYEMDWGKLKKGAYHLIVSCGFGTWGPPIRIGNTPEVVQITMTFQ